MKDIEIVALMAATIYASRTISKDTDTMREAVKEAEQLYIMVIEREPPADNQPYAWT